MKKNKLTKNFLTKQYVKNKKSIQQIANELGRSYTFIYVRLCNYNISRRTNSESHKGISINNAEKNGMFGVEPWNKNKIGLQKSPRKNKTLEEIFGKVKAKEIKLKMSQNIKGKLKGNKNGMFGVHRFGKDAPRYIDGRTPLISAFYKLSEYKNWRNAIFKKDNYTCQKCGQIGNYLHAHHIKFFGLLVTEFLKEYDQFSPIEDKEILVRLAMKWQPFWNIDNGKTLCNKCHKKIHWFLKQRTI